MKITQDVRDFVSQNKIEHHAEASAKADKNFVANQEKNDKAA